MSFETDSETRITQSDPVPSINTLEQDPSHPIHLLAADDALEQRISGYFRRAFGKDLIVFRGGGSVVPLFVGDAARPAEGEDRVSTSYLKRLRDQTVPLHEQGDGMRSFATMILHLLAMDDPSILMLDEPEAFLHPPQARLIGEFIAKERAPNTQLFIATHSPDLLLGLLSAAPDALRVIRLQRVGAVNRAKELEKDQAKRPFRNPAKTSLHGSPGTPKPAEIGYHVIAERPSEGPLNP
ncbi:ATP-binding protein, partial [Aurantimonas sp. C2-3-R2]|uniref:ATP-binding protein n=4 Tax=unclassified Aurantimonas TaxID=2638230 RepID=UPI002E16F631|nr:ATP-binding protein [Aurantimonas sp. C2-3-R2]